MTPIGAALISVAIGYAVAGRRYVRESVSTTNHMQRPFWVRDATLGTALLHWAIWPVGIAARQIYGNPGKELRYAAVAFGDIVFRMLPTATTCFLLLLGWRYYHS